MNRDSPSRYPLIDEPLRMDPDSTTDSMVSTVEDMCVSISITRFRHGYDTDGEAAGDRSGGSVKLSADGNTLAIGSSDNDGAGAKSGHVRVYRLLDYGWRRLDADGVRCRWGSPLVEILGRKPNIQSVFANDDLFPVSSKCRLGDSLAAVLLRPNSPLRILQFLQLGLHSFCPELTFGALLRAAGRSTEVPGA